MDDGNNILLLYITLLYSTTPGKLTYELKLENSSLSIIDVIYPYSNTEDKNLFQLVFVALLTGLMNKKRTVDAEPTFVDEKPPMVYYDPNDPTIGKTSRFIWILRRITSLINEYSLSSSQSTTKIQTGKTNYGA